MRKEDLDKFRLAIRFTDFITVIFFIVFIILLALYSINIQNLLGAIIGYISVKITFTRQLIKYKKEDSKIGIDMLINLIIYSLAMFIMYSISNSLSPLYIGTFLIIVYRQVALMKFKSLLSKRG